MHDWANERELLRAENHGLTDELRSLRARLAEALELLHLPMERGATAGWWENVREFLARERAR